ncbi:hypothetical protein [Nonomuraea sp. NPDC049646]|uniref:hypothetical protein n=1 Tax=unclassified Nonomuraea TaxID=2593643 RepID=UPI003794DE54
MNCADMQGNFPNCIDKGLSRNECALGVATTACRDSLRRGEFKDRQTCEGIWSNVMSNRKGSARARGNGDSSGNNCVGHHKWQDASFSVCEVRNAVNDRTKSEPSSRIGEYDAHCVTYLSKSAAEAVRGGETSGLWITIFKAVLDACAIRFSLPAETVPIAAGCAGVKAVLELVIGIIDANDEDLQDAIKEGSKGVKVITDTHIWWSCLAGTDDHCTTDQQKELSKSFVPWSWNQIS